MQELSFPLKIHKRRNGKRVLFVEHTQQGSYYDAETQAKQNQTRDFCNWIRKTFPDCPTEYKATTRPSYGRRRRRWDPANQYFVAYDLTPMEFMMIKLAFGFKEIKVRFTKEKIWIKDYWTGRRRYRTEAYEQPAYLPRFNIFPSDKLLERIEKNPGKYRKLTRNRQKKK